jgi:hypothetical protein
MRMPQRLRNPQSKRLVITFALLLSIGLNLVARPAQAQGRVVDDDNFTRYGVSCHDGECSLLVDLGPVDAEAPVPADAPITFDLPAGNLGFMSGAGIEISDQLKLNLPVGQIRIPEGSFDVTLDEAGQVYRLHGAAASMLPNLALPYNIKIGGEFASEFGYDFGSELGALSELLDPDERYFFLRVGDGFTFDTKLANENGVSEPITLSVPENESATIVIDPKTQVLYLDGRFNLSQVIRLVTLAATMGIDVGELPMLTGLVLPIRSTVGVAALLSRQPGRNFIEMNADLGIEGGPLGQLLRLGDNPLTLDSSIRIDRSGIKLQGVADTELMPQTFLDSGGTVEFFIPFGRLRDAYVRIGGELSVPIVGIAAGGDAQLGGGQMDEDGDTVADMIHEGPSWWDDATTWIGSTASATATGIAGGAQAGLDAIQDAADAARGLDTGAVKEGAAAAAGAVKEGAAAAAGAVTGGASTAAGAVAGSGVGSAAESALAGATSGVACGVNRAQQLWCRTTGFCEVPEDACAESAEEGQ